ncbi:unnamed protein product [Rhizophagus irregularis]|nr:unnamed protein product [Rhizophagus irregularis]CAB5377433.1 unnamed protein product [Rhizophagus irregularis]
MYLFLTGDSSALSNWSYLKNPPLTILKAEVLAEIELFYLLPHQRRWEAWFPEVMYYYANVDKTREEVKRLIKDGQWDTNKFSEMKKDLFNKLNIKNNPADEIDMRVLLEKIENIEKKL